jgi:hypothetical protein
VSQECVSVHGLVQKCCYLIVIPHKQEFILSPTLSLEEGLAYRHSFVGDYGFRFSFSGLLVAAAH